MQANKGYRRKVGPCHIWGKGNDLEGLPFLDECIESFERVVAKKNIVE